MDTTSCMDINPYIREFATTYPIMSAIMDSLSAYDVAKFTTVIGYKMTEREMRKYLNPLRDMGGLEPLLRDAIKAGHKVLFVGTELNLLIHRLTHPLEYADTLGHDYKIEIAIVMPGVKEHVSEPVPEYLIEQGFGDIHSNESKVEKTVESMHPSTHEMMSALGISDDCVNRHVDRYMDDSVLVEMDVPDTGVRIVMGYKEKGDDWCTVVSGDKCMSVRSCPGPKRYIGTTMAIDMSADPFRTQIIDEPDYDTYYGDVTKPIDVFVCRYANMQRYSILIPHELTGMDMESV